jgi:hypothetical protein
MVKENVRSAMPPELVKALITNVFVVSLSTGKGIPSTLARASGVPANMPDSSIKTPGGSIPAMAR